VQLIFGLNSRCFTSSWTGHEIKDSGKHFFSFNSRTHSVITALTCFECDLR